MADMSVPQDGQPQVISIQEANFMVDRVKNIYSVFVGQAASELAALQLDHTKLTTERAEMIEFIESLGQHWPPSSD